MKRQNDLRIVRGSKDLVGYAQEIYCLIKQESERNNMLAREISDIELEITTGQSFLAFLGEKFVGYVAIFPWQGLQLAEICSLLTKEPYRHQGIGTKLAKEVFGLADKICPENQIIALANQNSRGIFGKIGLTYLPKCCLPTELWSICPQCKEYDKLPGCHCRGMFDAQRAEECQIKPLFLGNEAHVMETAELYCGIWKEPPWNEDFWTVEGVVADMKQQLSKRNACGYVVVNRAKVVSFTWGYEVSSKELVEISGSHQLDMLFAGDKRVFYIDELGTAKAYRRRKLGKEISWRLLSDAESKGFDFAVLRTESQAVPARTLYQELGFQELPVFDKQHQTRTYWVLDLKPKIR